MKATTDRAPVRPSRWLSVLALLWAPTVLAQEGGSTPHGDAQQIVTTVCMACHGQDGNPLVPIFPKLAGQQEVYLAKQLADYKAGRRKNDVMAPAIARIDPSDIPLLAAFFAAQKPAEPAAGADASQVARGRSLYERGNLETGIPPCSACHEPQAQGDGRYARLAGQSTTYVAQTLADFKAGNRHNDHGRVMRNIAAQLDDADMQALAAYLASR